MTFTTSPTRTVRAGIERDSAHGAVVPPLYLSTNYAFAGFKQKRQYDYARSGNPTRDELSRALADLEHGAGAVVTSSGMSAITLVLELVPTGGKVVVSNDCYGGTWRLLDALARKGRINLEFVDLVDSKTAATAIGGKPALVWIETPSNPLLRIVDINHVAQLAHDAGALCVVDNTFLSPVLQQPLDLGADIVVHSTTKYINGHSDIVAGAAIARTQELADELAWWGNCLGLVGAPFDSWLTLRGLRTLHARMRSHQENAAGIVEALQRHDAVTAVHYPGLENHPQHALAKRQQAGFGAMVSFELNGGEEAVAAFLDGLEYFTLAESLGGVESLIAHPASMTHAAMTPEARASAGIPDSLLRLSVGIEHIDDLIADLDAALDRASATVRVPRAAQA